MELYVLLLQGESSPTVLRHPPWVIAPRARGVELEERRLLERLEESSRNCALSGCLGIRASWGMGGAMALDVST